MRVPGPRGLPFVGAILDFEDDPLGWMVRTREKYGDVVRLDSSMVVVHDPAIAHEVLRTTNDEYMLDNRLEASKRGQQELLDGLPSWMDARRYLARGVSRPILASHLPRLQRYLGSAVQDAAGHHEDLFDVTQRLLGAATADYCLGGGDEDLGEVTKAVEEMFWVSLQVTDSAESRIRGTARPIATRAHQLNVELVELLTEYVVRRRAAERPSEPRDILDALLAHPAALTDKQLANVVRLMVVTSHGPPGVALAWTLIRLGERPDLVDAIRAEQPGHDAVQTLAVVKEALRMHPPVWLMGRTALRPVHVGPYKLKAGQRVLMCPYLIHRDERFYDRPEEFRPERWLTTTPPAGDFYLPFGAGTRVCPGGRLGQLQLIVALITILATHNLQVAPVAAVRSRTSTLLIPGTAGGWIRR
ncbi:cytochrome P450 [Kribbella deserti]|uniref:Cytochrome P450 n=1 Tax=Kribbella deserti TaxID=1926257 RepID=A0ABV6QPY1_9ACTN